MSSFSMLDIMSPTRLAESEALLGEAMVATLKQVFLDALRVVEEVGFECPVGEVRQVLEGTGLAAHDETTGHIHILPELVARALEQAPKNDAFWIPMGSFGVGGTAPYVLDDQAGDFRTAEVEDIERLAALVEASDPIAFTGRGPMLHRRNAEAIQILARGTSKPIYVGVHSPEELAVLDEVYQRRGRMMVVWDVIKSPLELSDHMIPLFLESIRRGIPTLLASMPMPAISAPYSVTGLLTQCTAEFLIGLCIINAVNPSTMVVCGAFPTVTSIERDYALDLGCSSHNVVNMLMSHVARTLDIPSCQSGCTTNEEGPTARALADAKRGYAIFRRYGCHMIRHAFGFTKDLTALSFAKLERALEAFDETSADDAPDIRWPDYDPEAFDAIARNSSRANFMQDDHTLRNVGRAFWSD